jgi:general secretion pathway protein H
MRTNRTSKLEQAGFTLIEIMIVIAIMAAVIAVGAPKLLNTSAQMRSTVRKLAIATREIRNTARLGNVTSRLVISMSEEKGYSYWVESAPGNATMLSADQEKEMKALTESQRSETAVKPEFQTDTHVIKRPIQLPRGMIFESVEYAAAGREPIVAGTAYVHFFPQGLSEEVAIHMSNRKTLNWTVSINPLTGRADIWERKIALKELRNQQ